MSSEKLFNKTKLATKDINVTAVDITGRNLITGESNGTLRVYEIKQKQFLSISEAKLKSKIDKICIPKSRKIAFILSGGDVYSVNLPQIGSPQQIFKSKDIANLYVNLEDKKYENKILLLQNKGKLLIKIYEFDVKGETVEVNEERLANEMYLDKLPDFAIWSEKNYFVYSLNNKKCYWLNCGTCKIESSYDFENTVDIAILYGKETVTTNLGEGMTYTVFSERGKSISFNPVFHTLPKFHRFCPFENHSIALYDGGLIAFKPGEMEYTPVETINFDQGEVGQFMVASRFKLIVITTSGNQTNFIDIQGKPPEEKMRVLIDKKEYNKALEILIENSADDTHEEKETRLEEYYLDCAWACIEGDKKDFENSIKYLSLTNFNPFEFIYMFYDVLNIKIIHTDKEKEILDDKKENQFLNEKDSEEKQNIPLKFLISILKIKRDYILEVLIKSKYESETSLIEFMSSNKSKINLKSSSTRVTIGQTFYAINSSLIKCMIKLKLDPSEIEEVLDNETINYTNLTNFEKDPFFSNDKVKKLDETKFALSYISEKNEDNYEMVLEQYKTFGNSKDEKYCLIGKERTKKVFYKFKETKEEKREEKEKLFKKYIIWLLEKYQEEAFEVIVKTELISNKIFMEEIIPKIKSKEDLKEKFLEYCNKNNKTETYQTQLIQLYIDKLFKLTGKEKKPEKLEDEAQKYYNLMMDVIKSKDSVYNKKLILEYIEASWLKEPRLILYSQLKEFNKALEYLFKEAKETLSFTEMEEFCKNNNDNSSQKIFEKFYQLLSDTVKEYQDKINNASESIEKIKNNLDDKNPNNKLFLEEISKNEEELKQSEEKKKPFEKEMLLILNKYGNIDSFDPQTALDFANDHMNICQEKDFFNYLNKVVKDFTIKGNKNKITKNLSEMGLAYKVKEDYEIKKKYVIIDSEKICDLCKKKIGSIAFAVYPNMKVYHSKCAANINIDPLTGLDFSKTNYID